MLRGLIGESLRLWGIHGEVESDGAATTIRSEQAFVRIEPADGGLPFRWLVRWRLPHESAPGARERHPRACASVGGVLTALRSAFGIEGGAPVRVASASPIPVAQAPRLQAEPAFSAGEGACATPIVVLTGFLGSGKTTLLSRLLRDPAMARTAVIINEFGEIGLDHELVEASDESFVELSNGCLCCKVRSDLVMTLRDLARRRVEGTLHFERVVIETTGLADPAPILHALQTDHGVAERYSVEGVIATVDAITGADTLKTHAESARQAAVADCVIVTKTDAVADADVRAVTEAVSMLNPGAAIRHAANGEVDAATLLHGLGKSAHAAPPEPRCLPRHLHDIESVAIVRTKPLHAATLPLYLAALAENLGADLLRVKGIVGIAEAPATPAVIHGVQHVYHAPSWLDRWPSGDRRTRIVLIGRKVDRAYAQALLEAIDCEVAESAVGSPVA
ncbi:MAG TPA: GTP-binding protein [Burkholderiales bacterium]|nr:GTP-binding protein [Burkholderiales bacterium]